MLWARSYTTHSQKFQYWLNLEEMSYSSLLINKQEENNNNKKSLNYSPNKNGTDFAVDSSGTKVSFKK